MPHADAPPADAASIIREQLPLAAVPSLRGVFLHLATPRSGLRRLLDRSETGLPPYWAYPWAGGLALARHVEEHPEVVRGRHVLDFGAGSGLVGIAAALAGAAGVVAAETDGTGRVALGLNAAANGVELAIIGSDLTGGAPPPVDVVLAGDVFYDPAVAERALHFFDACLAAGIEVLIGDVGRAYLPLARLRRLAAYPVPDFGHGRTTERLSGGVYALLAEPPSAAAMPLNSGKK